MHTPTILVATLQTTVLLHFYTYPKRGKTSDVQHGLLQKDGTAHCNAPVCHTSTLPYSTQGVTSDARHGLLQKDATAHERSQQLSALRQRLGLLESHLKAKDREVERTSAALTASRSAEAEYASRHAALEAAARQVDAHVGALRQQLLTALAAARSRKKEVDALARAVDDAQVGWLVSAST